MTGLQEVAPTGSATSNRQAEMMYLLRRYILGRNFFLRPDCVHHVPEAVRRYHSKRFREAYEAVKRLDYSDGIVTQGSAREGRKHNIQLGFASQRLTAMGDGADQPVDRAVRSHLLPERRVSDAFVNVVLAEIALPLLRAKAKRSYSGAELRELCAGAGRTSCLNPKMHRRETLHPRPPGRRRDRGLCAR